MKITPELLTKAYTRGIQSALKGLATDGSDLHENYTPPVICDIMLDKLDLTQPKSILVLYNLELLFALKLRKYTGPVTFFTQSPTKAEIAPKFLPGVEVEYIDKEENPLYFMENKWPEKFDIVVANPPYSKKLDLKFLDKAFDIAKEEVVFVHPATFITDRKGGLEIFMSLREKIKESIKNITLFNGNGVFEIGLYVPCCITHISHKNNSDFFSFSNLINDKGRTELKKDEINNISIFGYSPNFMSIEKKIEKYKETLSSKSFFSRKEKLPSPNKYIVSTSRIQGASTRGKIPLNYKMYNDDFFVLLRKNTNITFNQNPRYDVWWEFNSEIEAKNFISYCKTNFARVCLSLTKNDCSINGIGMSKVPWIDFTQEWTDEKLYAHFNITEEEQAFIKEVIPPYYD